MDQSMILFLLGFVVVGAVLCVLALLVIRGRFGTPQRRAVLDLTELAGSRDLPRGTTMRRTANCMGHSAKSAPVRGNGVLWLTEESLGFTVLRPRRDFVIDLTAIESVRTSSVVRRPGVKPIKRANGEFLVVEWTEPTGTALVSWTLSKKAGSGDERDWVEAIERSRVLREVRV